MGTYAPEFTPELSKSYLDSILGGIDQQGRVDEGKASAEAAARGLDEQGAFIGSSIGQVRSGVARDKSSAVGQFNLNVANQQASERLGSQAHDWSVAATKEAQDFTASQSALDRSFSEKMAQMGYAFQGDQAAQDRAFNPEAFAGGLVTSAVGGYAGGVGRSGGF
jgi:hypothetical protein